MSTPKHKKLERQRMHQEQKRKREYEKLLASVPKKQKREFIEYKTPETFHRETPNYPSCSNTIAGYAPRKESQKYTGTYIKGIATMHKSNAIPIVNKEQAIEVSQMRRS
jgi:hypothetical protein